MADMEKEYDDLMIINLYRCAGIGKPSKPPGL